MDNKIAIVIKNDLLIWQKLNVTSFLASAIAIKFNEVHGKEMVNGSNSTYLPLINQPILVFKSDSKDELKRAFLRAKDRSLNIGVYDRSFFATKTEAENHKVFEKTTDLDNDLVGIIVYGESKKVDKAFKGLKLHS